MVAREVADGNCWRLHQLRRYWCNGDITSTIGIVSGLPTTRSASSELLRGVAMATNLFTQSESMRVAFHSDEFLQVYH